MPDIVLSTGPLGGLGDWLLYSTLPERFAKLGYTVYASAENRCRNDGTAQLLYANPHIVGTSEKASNAGYDRQGLFYDMAQKLDPCSNLTGSIAAMEAAHGLLPPYSIAPKVYYAPRPYVHDLRETVLVDFTAISVSLTQRAVDCFMQKMHDRFEGCRFLGLSFPRTVVLPQSVTVPVDGEILVESIWQYVDMLACARAWIGGESGGHHLASAVRQSRPTPEVVALLSVAGSNSCGCRHPNVHYRHEGEYYDPCEVPRDRFTVAAVRSVEASRTAAGLSLKSPSVEEVRAAVSV